MPIDLAAADRLHIAYASHADTFGELSTPAATLAGPPYPVVVLVHGGFWRERYRLDLMHPLVASLTARGAAVWNIEYRRVGGSGGYPHTLVDVAAAIDHLAVIDTDCGGGVFDLTRVAVVGHSAGGHLAAWAAGRDSLPRGTPGAEPAVVPRLCVVQAGVVDLVGAAEQQLGDGACIDLLDGTPHERPARYATASPLEVLPTRATVLLVHGALDDDVPLRQSETYLARALAGGVTARLIVDHDAGHYEHLDPEHPMWWSVLEELSAAGITGGTISG